MWRLFTCCVLALWLAGCGVPGAVARPDGEDGRRRALATTTFLADIAQQVAGERFAVASLLPPETEPHAFEPTPGDVRRLADADLIITHGQGLERSLAGALAAVPKEKPVVEAAAGLVPRAREGAGRGDEADMHYWLDPNLALTYVENIRAGLTAVDPAGAAAYAANAAAYSVRLRELDAWVRARVAEVPPARRLLVTDHESLGYFADRYGFRFVGAVIPSVGAGAAPSAGQVASLVAAIKRSGAPAIFVELGGNRQLVEQVAAAAGVRIGAELYSHTLSKPGGPAATYEDMIRYNVEAIVAALK